MDNALDGTLKDAQSLAEVGRYAESADAFEALFKQDPSNLEAQLDVVDLDISGGHIEDAFDRLLSAFPLLDADGKTTVRTRLLELFDVVGLDDPRVGKARARLTNLLF